MLITRKLINPNIKFRDVNRHVVVDYDYKRLCEQIDAYKNLLQNTYQCQPGQHIVIGVPASINQTAMVFACAELALSITIVDYSRDDDFADDTYVDPKTKLLLPIDYFVMDSRLYYESHGKYRTFERISGTTIYLDSVELDYTGNEQVLANGSTEMIRCTSSGTTGTPKIIKHSHEFLYHLIVRNSSQFSGSAGMHFNLQHGSSFATYFMPILASSTVTDFTNFKEYDYRLFFNHKIDHLMIPYPHTVEKFLQAMIKFLPDLTIYTLSYIKREWAEYVRKGAVKNFISIFGSNETSGPVFLNSVVPVEDFAENRFYKVDDFYQLTFDAEDGAINVGLPYYDDLTIRTNDRFDQQDGYYYHLGRNDLIRINGLAVDLAGYRDIIHSHLPCDIVYDTVKSAIYLAVWEQVEDLQAKLQMISDSLSKASEGRHTIDKYAVLDYDTFMRGVKIDHELLRDYFRNYV